MGITNLESQNGITYSRICLQIYMEPKWIRNGLLLLTNSATSVTNISNIKIDNWFGNSLKQEWQINIGYNAILCNNPIRCSLDSGHKPKQVLGDLRLSGKKNNCYVIPYLSTPGIGAWSAPVVQTFHTLPQNKYLNIRWISCVFGNFCCTTWCQINSYLTQELLFVWKKNSGF